MIFHRLATLLLLPCLFFGPATASGIFLPEKMPVRMDLVHFHEFSDQAMQSRLLDFLDRRSFGIGAGLVFAVLTEGCSRQPPPMPLENLTRWAALMRQRKTGPYDQTLAQARQKATDGTRAMAAHGHAALAAAIRRYFNRVITLDEMPATAMTPLEKNRQKDHLAFVLNTTILSQNGYVLLRNEGLNSGFYLGTVESVDVIETTRHTAHGDEKHRLPLYRGEQVPVGESLSPEIIAAKSVFFGTSDEGFVFVVRSAMAGLRFEGLRHYLDAASQRNGFHRAPFQIAA